MTKIEALIKQYKNALLRLKESLDAPKNDIVRDSAIQRFEFTLDLSWKLMKAFLEEKYGIVCASPKECFREAYRQGVIEYDENWIKFVDMRNETVHTYREEMADKIYQQLPNAFEYFKKLEEIIDKKI